MGETTQGCYWDLEQAAWVRHPQPVAGPEPVVAVPEQQTAVENEQQVDVRSG